MSPKNLTRIIGSHISNIFRKIFNILTSKRPISQPTIPSATDIRDQISIIEHPRIDPSFQTISILNRSEKKITGRHHGGTSPEYSVEKIKAWQDGAEGVERIMQRWDTRGIIQKVIPSREDPRFPRRGGEERMRFRLEVPWVPSARHRVICETRVYSFLFISLFISRGSSRSTHIAWCKVLQRL